MCLAHGMSFADELQDRLYNLAQGIIEYCRTLPGTRESAEWGSQLRRAGTSASANYRATRRSRSRDEWRARLGLVVEELDEADHWLTLIRDSGLDAPPQNLITECCQLRAILATSRATSRRKAEGSRSSKPTNSQVHQFTNSIHQPTNSIHQPTNSPIHQVQAKKRLGQHFLEPAWADKVVDAIDPKPGDRFLEIGPGPGALTTRLARRVAHVTAVEVDRAMVAALAPELPPNVRLVHGDFLEFDASPLLDAGPLRVAGNLPYNVSSPILFRLVDLWRARRRAGGSAASLVDATVMVQLEVAERIEAGPGTRDYGVLSILIQLHADVRRRLTLPPGAFRPMPAVRSAVIRISFRPPPVEVGDEGALEALVRSIFTQRRKMLANALRPFAESRGRRAASVLEAAGIDARRRPETLQLAELARLAQHFTSTDPPAVL